MAICQRHLMWNRSGKVKGYTNNGDIINKMMRAANKHEKEYKVTVDKEITED